MGNAPLASHLDAVQRYLADRRAEMIELMRLLTAIPALGPLNGGAGEWDKAQLLIDYLRQAGLGEIEECDAQDASVAVGKRPNLATRLTGTANRPATWIVSHLDVVPPGEIALWDHDPYELQVDENRLIGRGTEDNHQGVVASVFALLAVRDLGMPLRRSVGIGFVADEETGNLFGVDHVLKAGAFFRPGDIIIAPDTGCGADFAVEVAEKTILQVRVSVHGKQCHSSMPYLGRNAHRAAARLVLALDALHTRFSDADALYEPDFSTFEPTRHDANVGNINTIPGREVFYLDCRILPQYPVDEVLAAMRQIAGSIEAQEQVQVDIENVYVRPSAPPVDELAPDYQAVRHAVRDIANTEARRIGMGVGTVATFLRRAGYPAVVYCQSDNRGHQPNEYCRLDFLERDTLIFAHAMLQDQE